MSVFEMPLAVALESFGTVGLFASKDDVTPVLMAAHVSAGKILATDRYAVGRYRSELVEGEGDGFLLPSSAIAWIAGIKRNSLRHGRKNGPSDRDGYASDPYRVRVEWDGADVAVSLLHESRAHVAERSQTFDSVEGNFPPVERLFPDVGSTGGEIAGHFQAWQMERLARAAKFFDKRANIRLEAIAAEGAGKLTPMYFSVHGTPFDGLIQPSTPIG